MKQLFFTLSIIFVYTFSYAQTPDAASLTASQLKTIGINSMNMGDVYSAIDYFEVYCEKKTDGKIMFLLAECYREARNYPLAKKWYEQAYKENPNKNVLALYHHACMLQTERKYEEARSEFTKFRRAYRGIKRKRHSTDYNRLARNKIKACETAEYIIDSAITVKVEHLSESINKASIEFAPRFYNDTILLYASLRSDTAVYKVVEGEQDNVPKRQFYLGQETEDNWKYICPWNEGSFNDESKETGNGVFTPDYQQFYFTRCAPNRRMESICKIYMSTRKGKNWTLPEALPEIINNPKYTSTQPAVGYDSRKNEVMLFFVTDGPGGKGNLDIWYTTFDKRRKTWKDPRNCGPKVNSPGNELTPFYDNRTRTLFFSSNGQEEGLGELDIYRTVGERSSWNDKAENIGYPINSEFDDLYYTLHNKGKKGFFTSNRPGSVTVMHETCCDDIFSFEYIDYVELAAQGKVYKITNERLNSILKGKLDLTEKENSDTTKNYIEGALVTLFLHNVITDNTLFIAQDTTNEKGEYFFSIDPNKNYVIEFENLKEAPRKVKLSTHGYLQSDTIEIDDVGIEYISKEAIVLKNIYYEFDEHKLSKRAKATLDTTLVALLKEAPEIVIELSSHTDSKGKDDYNQKLSQKRAESVVAYLIQKGIDKKRLHPKGYGETKPIAPNNKPDGSDNPEGRQKNRRTEFRVIGTLHQYSEIIYEE
ncbi:MAG: OmpA family protein [Bacteroidales bacterium]|nr:OmpA family protein [Bacteroidales bacterium]